MATSSRPLPTHGSSALLDHLARLSRLRSEAALAPLGLRPRHLVALTVLRDHDRSTQQSLAQVLHIDSTNLVGLLNELEERRLIARRRAADDRRRHIVELTDEGLRLLEEAECTLAAAEDELLGGLDSEERETLYRILQRATASHALDCGAAAAESDEDCPGSPECP